MGVRCHLGENSSQLGRLFEMMGGYQLCPIITGCCPELLIYIFLRSSTKIGLEVKYITSIHYIGINLFFKIYF